MGPSISIGVPVYNGAGKLELMLDALLKQTFADYEIIISDNASTDGTAAICARYAAQDARIRYFRQSENVGPQLNYRFVLCEARSPYFMWSACDDIRSPDFLEENIEFLKANPDYVASTCPNCFEGEDPAGPALVTFSIEGNVKERFDVFLDKSWASTGIFYGLIRTDVLKGFELAGQSFMGADWALILYLIRRGSIHRTKCGLMICGASGESKDQNAWRRYRSHPVSWIFPFYRVSLYAFNLASGFTVAQRMSLMKRLLKLNAQAAYSQFHFEFYPFYFAYIKPWLRTADKRRFEN
jgi:glycosyltransferase involved in cell wall biosynthesis